MRLRKFPASIALIALLLITLLSGFPTTDKQLRSVSAQDGGVMEPVEPPSVRSKITFLREKDLFVVNPDGSRLTQLTFIEDETQNYQPALSPDGSRIAYGFSNSAGSGIRVMNSDGTDVITLTTTAVGYDGEPAWSPDGVRIAFVRGGDPTARGFANSTICTCEIYTIEVDHPEYGLSSVTNGLGGTDPSWSPDSYNIAFVSNRYDDNYEIYKYSIGNDQVYRLTYTPEHEAEPAWSPDGRHIAFASGYLDDSAICGFAHTGLGQLALVNGPDIFVMDPEGANLTRITETGNNFDPVWSPDSSSLCFIGFDNYTTQLFVLDSMHKLPYPITTEGGDKSSPSWSR